MATSLLALLDDITTVLDDVAVLSKVAAKKTAGVLGDDLALNAQQVAGVQADRELPVVWAVAKGSFLNKAILVPAALLIASFAPWAITPLLMVGGAFLCFEGAEKLAHRFLHGAGAEAAERAAVTEALLNPQVDMAEFERDKIKGAVRTDFILSAEIIAITLGTVTGRPLVEQAGVLALVAVVMTVGVYGLVAAIVKMDDAGLWLSQRPGGGLGPALGRGLLRGAPLLMKALSVAGTAAMFLVGGSILLHGVPPLHHAVQGVVAAAGSGIGWLVSLLGDALTGLVAGALVLAGVEGIKRLRGGAAPAH